jgi:phage FluMu protein gp41
MTAHVVILPTARTASAVGARTVIVSLSRRDFARLAQRAKEWRVEPEEAAAWVLARALEPRKRR